MSQPRLLFNWPRDVIPAVQKAMRTGLTELEVWLALEVAIPRGPMVDVPIGDPATEDRLLPWTPTERIIATHFMDTSHNDYAYVAKRLRRHPDNIRRHFVINEAGKASFV